MSKVKITILNIFLTYLKKELFLNPSLHCTLQIIKDRDLISLMTRPCKFGLETYNSWGGESPHPHPPFILDKISSIGICLNNFWNLCVCILFEYMLSFILLYTFISLETHLFPEFSLCQTLN